MKDIYKTWIGDFGVDGFRIDTMKHVNDEFWQEFGPRGPRVRESSRARTSSSCSARSSTPPRASPRSSPPATRCRPCWTSRSRTPPATSPPRASDASPLETFFAGDDWYTDADSNVYQLPTFLGNHDMGRIGSFIAADNPGAADAELVARDRLAHELMYFSRGNPVIYYGDEQGFTGPGGDQDARQTLFASQVPEYLDDDLLGTDATHAQDNFNAGHPLYSKISELAALDQGAPGPARRRPPAPLRLRRARHLRLLPHRRGDQREYVVALNNSEQPQTAGDPHVHRASATTPGFTATARSDQDLGTDGEADGHRPAAVRRGLPVGRPDPALQGGPAVSLQEPAPAAEATTAACRSRPTSAVRRSTRSPSRPRRQAAAGADRHRRHRAVPGVPRRQPLRGRHAGRYRAVVLDNAGHQRSSVARSAPCRRRSDHRGAGRGRRRARHRSARRGRPERASQWCASSAASPVVLAVLGTDTSSPDSTSVQDDVEALPLGTTVSYRAVLIEPGFTERDFSAPVHTVTTAEPEAGPGESVTVAGSLQDEMGCAAD